MNGRATRVLVTGATGYVGGRLVPRLLEAGYRVRCLARDPSRLRSHPWAQHVEVALGDALEPGTLRPALAGVDVIYFLIHNLHAGRGFHHRDREAACYIGRVACESRVRRIIYLGGLGDPRSDLSAHLRSRQEVGEILRRTGIPTTEFRAAIIVGSGSLSFEMIRYLVERLPVIICPRWVYTRVQPIAIRDVLAYLIAALTTPESAGRIIEIGGADVLTYGQMMLGYARARGLRRLFAPVPVLSPNLSAHWVHWLTPIPASVVHPLIEGLRNEVVVRDPSARKLFPRIQPIDYATAVRLALKRLEAGHLETSWRDALGAGQADLCMARLADHGGIILERRCRRVAAPPEAVFRVFSGIGGKRGWFYANATWHLRALLDALLGGVGFRRGRRHPDDLRVGDSLDFWRVESVTPGRLIRLRAEMKVPGIAWLQFEARPQENGLSLLEQTAFFAPRGLLGFLYWYVLYPLHAPVFAGLARAIARRAEEAVLSEARPPEEVRRGASRIAGRPPR